MKIHLPNSAHLYNFQSFLRHLDFNDPQCLTFSMHNKWVSVHPLVLAIAACAGARVQHVNGEIAGNVEQIKSLPYLIRMGLFEYIPVHMGQINTPHEKSGRFVTLTQIKSGEDLHKAVTELIPLLHTTKDYADPIRYIVSEMGRNAIEHAASPVGAIFCAQFFQQTGRVSIGIADAGMGILNAMKRSHNVSSHREAILLALQPGVTGVTARPGGNETNAGAGLFFTKSIASLSRNFFVLYSGDCMYKLWRGSSKKPKILQPRPTDDAHVVQEGFPKWQGTAVGIDVKVEQGTEFSALLETIRQAYKLDTKRAKSEYYKRVKFT